MSYHLNSSLRELLSGTVAHHPFSWLPSIVARARAQLQSRSNDQIEDAALSIDWAIEEYFRELKDQEIDRLRLAAKECGDVDSASSLMIDEDDIVVPTRHTTSQVDALKACIDLWDDIGGEGFPNAKRYEAFAVLSLSLVGGAVSWLLPKRPLRLSFPNGTTWEPDPGNATSAIASSLSLASECALEAMDAVCYAEQLRALDQQEAQFHLRLGSAHSEYQDKEARRVEENRRRKSMQAEKLNAARHRLDHEVKAMVIEEWSRDQKRWPSAAQAGNDLVVWLHQNTRYVYQPGTLIRWIREFKRATKTGE